ncbi:MAG: DUF3598 family protein [Elainella sp.]
MTELSQWQRLLKNVGVWQGSFTRLSATGELQANSPSCVTLEPLNQGQTMRQTIRQFTEAEETYSRVLEYSSLNRGTLFFADGSFSQGSLQFGPLSEFGAEFGFIAQDRRLRLVQQFDKDSQLAQFTLIREHRQGSSGAERPPLTPDQLVGEWQGEAVTLYPDWRESPSYPTRLKITLQDNQLTQQLSLPELAFTSRARVEGSLLLFEQGRHPIQVLLLPDGASANTPLRLPPSQPFLLEAGWLIQDQLRQRMIRSYDAKGEWVSLTLVTERKLV